MIYSPVFNFTLLNADFVIFYVRTTVTDMRKAIQDRLGKTEDPYVLLFMHKLLTCTIILYLQHFYNIYHEFDNYDN